jgi:hypothetical protein
MHTCTELLAVGVVCETPWPQRASRKPSSSPPLAPGPATRLVAPLHTRAGQARPIFPFTAVIGQEEMKLALILNVIDPKIGGVMIMGDRGTGAAPARRQRVCVCVGWGVCVCVWGGGGQWGCSR